MSNSNSNLNKRAKEDGNTPLIISLKYKKYNITKYLLSDQNINVNKGNRRGYKPLIYMIKNNINEEEIFKKIIEKDEDINNSQYFKNATPLIYAIKKNNVRAIKFLLESKKVDINKRDDNNYCPLDYAIQEKNIEIIELLYDSLNECNNNIRLNEEQNKNRKLENSLYHLLFIGIIYGNKKLIKYLINQDIDINYLSENEENESLTPLICAIKNKQNNIIKFLLKSSRIDVNKPNKEGLTPLIYAIKNKQDDIIKLLLKSSNIDVNKPDKEGLTPLIYAIKNKQDDTIKLLLKSSNIDVNKPNMEGLTHLIYCGISNDDNGNNNNNKKN
ncbi:ankyrin repeat-containing domain protein, partial [Neocallimastix sp. 'constans']